MGARLSRWLVSPLAVFFCASSAHSQMPFYTDDPSVTDVKTLHIEVFDEVDGLQASQYPDLRQNTANVKVNFSPWPRVEFDLDAPYLTIDRAPRSYSSRGIGDTNLGIKWKIVDADEDSLRPTFAASFYVEFPTGNAKQELGSGLIDYWLNIVAQAPFSATTRLTGNLGILFAGNTSTGAVGIQTQHGHVYTAGVSLLHDFTPKVTLGAELYGGVADTAGLDGTQLQAMLGAQFAVRDNLTLSMGILGGKFGATPRIGGQVGFSVDLPVKLR